MDSDTQTIQKKTKKISVICFDRKGGDYADIPQKLGSDWRHYSVHDGLHLGLNNPDGVPPMVWINIVATLFTACMGLVSSWVTLANVMRWLVAVMNPTPGKRLLWPDWHLILEVLNRGPETLFSRKVEYVRSLKQCLEGITQASGSLFRTFSGLELERDIVQKGKSVIFSMPNMVPTSLRRIAIYLLVAQLLFGRIHRNQRVRGTDALCIIDEADQDISREAEAAFADRLSPIGALLKQGREFGLACCLGVSHLGNVSRFILTNVQYHLISNLSDDESVVEARRTLLLPRGAELQLPALKPGEAIFRESQSGWVHPMWVKVDEVPPCYGNMTPEYDTHPFAPSEPLDNLPHVEEALKKLIAEKRGAKLREDRAKQSGLSKNARQLLDLAGLHPLVPVARLWPRIGDVSPTSQAAARKEIEDRKLAIFEEVRCGRRNVLLIYVTDTGWKFLNKTPPKRKGRGAISHTHFCDFVKRVGKARGHEAYTEWIVPGTTHPVDAVWRIDDEWHAFEVVVTCKTNLVDHLKTCFLTASEVSTVTIVAPQKGILADLKKIIDAETALESFGERIAYASVELFIKEAYG